MDYSDWLDENHLLHHKKFPTNETSENELLFTAELLLLEAMTENPNHMLIESSMGMRDFYNDQKIQGKHISHDNKTGLVSIWKGYNESIFKVGKRWWLHPRDIVYYGYMKHGAWFWPLLPIVSIANIISCARTYKVHKDRPEGQQKHLTTSGKMLAFVRNKAAGLTLTHKICTWLIERNDKFLSWYWVSKIYFGEHGHPIPKLMRDH